MKWKMMLTCKERETIKKFEVEGETLDEVFAQMELTAPVHELETNLLECHIYHLELVKAV